jgi:hypothetical protein
MMLKVEVEEDILAKLLICDDCVDNIEVFIYIILHVEGHLKVIFRVALIYPFV